MKFVTNFILIKLCHYDKIFQEWIFSINNYTAITLDYFVLIIKYLKNQLFISADTVIIDYGYIK